ncbi:VOC family protein [Streptomyces minutiscleroticus]|uniref:VOC family protein n=1 Tax=Streptomyces minutiscleroticus TaxID=68238 RepID=UPI0033308398
MTEAPELTGPNGTGYGRHAPGAPCRVSLMVHGLAATQEFYGALFGWEFRPGPRQPGPYVRAMLDGREVADIGQLPPGRRLPVAWTPYLASDDVDLTAAAVRSCGGTVGVGPLDAADAGRMAVAVDPSGAVFGLWQATGPLREGAACVPGAPARHELITRDAAVVARFYRSVFGYEQRPHVSADFDCVSLLLDGRPVAEIRGMGRVLPRDRGSHWITYFAVPDVDAAAERLTALGGRVARRPHDTPLGRAAAATDPEGALFGLVDAGL